MSRYRRLFVPGGTYFFTLVTWHRRPLLASEERIELLRDAFRQIKTMRPFVMGEKGPGPIDYELVEINIEPDPFSATFPPI